MTSFDPRQSVRGIEIGVNDGSSLSMSPDTSSSTSTRTPHLSYELPIPLDDINFSMYDPAMLPDSYFSDAYFPTDPLFLGDSFDIFNEDPNTIQMPRTTSASAMKPSPVPSSATPDGNYRLSPLSSRNDSYPLASPSAVLTEDETSTDITKRQRAAHPDTLSACWTSPLCPNVVKEGTPPSPSTCNGGCAPFLFGDVPLPDLNIDTALLGINIAAEDRYNSPIDEKPRTSSKRSESVSNKNNVTPSQNGRRQSKLATHTKGRKSSNSQPEESIAESIEDLDVKGKKRIPHNEVERKYRDSVNNQMDCLRRVIPDLRPSPKICDGTDIEDLPAPSKPSKAVILASATAYIKKMEKEKKDLKAELELCELRVKALQALVKCDDCSLMQYVMNMNLRGGKT
jgi:hypothetical protein